MGQVVRFISCGYKDEKFDFHHRAEEICTEQNLRARSLIGDMREDHATKKWWV